MVTKAQALTANNFHMDACTRVVGPRGGIQERITQFRRNGRTVTWVTRPDDFRIPVVHGLKSYGYITDRSARDFHIAAECPIIDACCSCDSFGHRDIYCFCKCHTV